MDDTIPDFGPYVDTPERRYIARLERIIIENCGLTDAMRNGWSDLYEALIRRDEADQRHVDGSA